MKFLSLVVGITSGVHALSQQDFISLESNSTHNSTNFCKMNKDDFIGATCDISFKEINDLNGNIREELFLLVHSDFFKYFKLDLYKQCPFWNDNNGYCVNRACAVDVIEDWDNIPEYWQPEVLGSLEGDNLNSDQEDDECTFLDQLCDQVNNIPRKSEDIEYCDTKDFDSKQSVLVDLTSNPERFTGYGGEESSQIWSSIYKENCFSLSETGQNLAKEVFYRLISGLHASIATHLSNEYLNTETGAWEPNLDLFMLRVGNFPDRVANIYFNYAVVGKALWKIQPYLSHLEFCNAYNEDIRTMVNNVISNLDTRIFNEDLLFQDDISSKLKNDFRVRFKNITKIMDCVHCDRCRLWGKVQTTGYATSLKILFEISSGDDVSRQHVVDKLTKYELIALFNTFDRLSKSIEAIKNFEKLYNDRLDNLNNGKLSGFFQTNNFFRILKKARNSLTSNINTIVSENSEIIEKFEDIILPQKTVKIRKDIEKNKWQNAWNVEIDNVKEAIRFIYKSYIDFPKNLGKILLLKVNHLWNKFIGIPNYVNEQDVNHTQYKLEIR